MKPVSAPKIDQLIDRQMRLWEVRRKLADEGGQAARREMVHLEEGPWLTISKQHGSGGVELARKLGESLGWQVFNKKILAGIAQNTHLRERVLSILDEKKSSWLSEYLTHLMTPESISRDVFARELNEVLWALARQGRAVLVGRGANWVLDPRYGLRVRTVAPLDHRVDHVAEAEQVGRDEARRLIEKTDSENTKFIRKTFGREIDDPLGYDLILNLGELPLDAAAEIVQTALRLKLHAAG